MRGITGKVGRIGAVALAIAIACAPRAQAATLTIVLDDEFSGATDPAGTLTAVFTDLGANLVELTLTGSLQGTEMATWWGFNLDPALDPTLLLISPVDTAQASPYTVDLGPADAYKADGDGFYDILFQWGNGIFTGTDSMVFNLSYTGGGLDALDFNFKSCTNPECQDAGGNPAFTSAAHIQGIGSSGAQSGWIGGDGEPGGGGGDGQTPGEVPEPASLLLLGSGLAMVANRVRRRNRG